MSGITILAIVVAMQNPRSRACLLYQISPNMYGLRRWLGTFYIGIKGARNWRTGKKLGGVGDLLLRCGRPLCMPKGSTCTQHVRYRRSEGAAVLHLLTSALPVVYGFRGYSSYLYGLYGALLLRQRPLCVPRPSPKFVVQKNLRWGKMVK